MGMVRQWQEMFYDKRYSNSYFDALPDFVKLAESYGHIGIKVTKASEVEGALKTAIETKDRLVFIDFITDPEENVYPMIAAGKGHNEMHLTKRGSK
jgi:acetolactate synthase-1/2/3 large subunit